ncbi:MAG: hypothetical protein BWX80_03119 [Candidatus Hydrogenedentes bacterium ADurb.Bin101]|nr:MAG: hypothetical protein BWX80_03119 [Candidatus Hydrogenedentes bacterium ADurb.Bin101]
MLRGENDILHAARPGKGHPRLRAERRGMELFRVFPEKNAGLNVFFHLEIIEGRVRVGPLHGKGSPVHEHAEPGIVEPCDAVGGVIRINRGGGK